MSMALNYCSLRGWFGSYDNAVFGAILILIISLAPEGPLKPLGLWLRRWSAAASLRRPVAQITFHGPHKSEARDPTPRRKDRRMALLEVESVRRSFGGLVAVDGVSLGVSAGQIKGVIGPNGAGKTTLFNMISGLLKPDAGQIMFKGRPINGLKPYQIARAGISRTFQNPSLFLQMNVLENVMVGPPQPHALGLLWLRPALAGPTAGRTRHSRGRPRPTGGRRAWRTWPTGRRARCRSASGGWSSWRARWPPNPRCCCWTSPPAD